MNNTTGQVIVKTTGGMHRVCIRGPIPIPATADEADGVIEWLLDIGF